MASKGIAALRASRRPDQGDPCAEALRRLDQAGYALRDAWCKRIGERMLVIEFSGLVSLQLRTDAGDFGTWSLWFAGTRIGLYRSPGDALAEAKARGFLNQQKEK